MTPMNSWLESASDDDLLQHAAKGDQLAFEQLYLRHSPAAFRYLHNLLRREEAAEEILQETFLAVWEQAALFEGRAKVKTWIFRIARNKAISWLRAHRDTVPLDDRLSLSARLSPKLSPEDADALRQALNDLSPKHREVLELAFGQGLSYNEIALVLSCPVGTVKSRVKYALERMGSLLGRNGWDS
ncbi:MAG: sigma-70 family RNA polymerase sigma factor [Anaerolineales bacterium]